MKKIVVILTTVLLGMLVTVYGMENEDKSDVVVKGVEIGCIVHTFNFHNINGIITEYAEDKWGRNEEYNQKVDAVAKGMMNSLNGDCQGAYGNIKDYIDAYSYPKEAFVENNKKLIELGETQFQYTKQQIDAMYSDDTAKMKEAFKGAAAVYHDGELYTIFWLASHTVSDYEAVGLKSKQIEKMLTEIKAWPDYESHGTYNGFQVKNYVEIIENKYRALNPGYEKKTSTLWTWVGVSSAVVILAAVAVVTKKKKK